MKRKLLISFLSLIMASPALAELTISEARIKSPLPGQTVSAGYFEATNTGAETISIVGVSSDSAPRLEIHTHKEEDGMMRMVKLDQVDIEPGQSLTFVEGGHHLMVFEPDYKTLASGEFDFIFELDDGSQVEVIASVEQRAQ